MSKFRSYFANLISYIKTRITWNNIQFLQQEINALITYFLFKTLTKLDCEYFSKR